MVSQHNYSLNFKCGRVRCFFVNKERRRRSLVNLDHCSRTQRPCIELLVVIGQFINSVVLKLCSSCNISVSLYTASYMIIYV